jgi:acyl-CoA synthetase (AMP-forming)/AMP-acid ligase II
MKNFAQQLEFQLTKQPDKPILVFQRAGRSEIFITYQELFFHASRYALALDRAGVQSGEVVILILQHSIELIFAYLGAILNGSIPSIMPFLTEKLLPEKYQSDLVALMRITRPAGIITYREFQAEMDGLLLEVSGLKTVLNCENIESQEISPDILSEYSPPGSKKEPEETVLLQHSSGSTGLQKGVALSHQAVFNQIKHYSEAIGLTEDDVIVSWLPLYHDMGLIACFLMPILFGTQLVLMSPFDWVKAPVRLLRSISDYRGTLCWLPNFAYNFCAKKVRDTDLDGVDLSSLRAVINCSEPMRFESHQIFLEKFTPYGFKESSISTCYAMAENVFAVTQNGIHNPVTYDHIDLEYYQRKKYAKPTAEDENSIMMVSAGKPIDNTEVRIIDGAGKTLSERHLGEIVISSDCMLTGYYNREDETEKSFIDGWFKTGDLGYIADGEVYISGRKKDLIIVGGKNIYPQDIENLVSDVRGVHPGRVVAFGLFSEDKGTEDVVVIAEYEDEFSSKISELSSQIRQNITKSTAIALRTVYLVPEKWLIKTSSGKIARAANREKYLKETAQ